MYCEHCGTKIDTGSEFCQNCGKPTSKANTAVSADANQSVTSKSAEAIIKCGNCGYEGVGEKARSIPAIILAWLCIFVAPIITLIYFAVSHKYRCPKCKSTFVGVKNKEGKFVGQKDGASSPLMVFVWILIAVAIISILLSVVLDSLNTEREKARAEAQVSAIGTYASGSSHHALRACEVVSSKV